MRSILLNGDSIIRQTAGGLKFTSVSGELTLNEVAVFGSTGVERTILPDQPMLVLYHDIMGMIKPINKFLVFL